MVYRAALLSVAVCLLAGSPLFAITRSWTGSTSANWSDPSNWSPSGTPTAADTLVFPAGASNRTMTNDLPAGTSFGPMTFNDNYTLSGNALTLTGSLSFAPGNSLFFTCNADLKLANSLSFGSSGVSLYNGAIDVNGQTLTIDTYNTTLAGALNGGGTVNINGLGMMLDSSGTFSGAINGVLNVSGSLPNATVSANRLSGAGTIGNATVPGPAGLMPGNEPVCCFTPAAGVLHTKSLTLTGPARMDLVASGTSDQVQVTGSVTLGGPLNVSILSGSPTAGQTFTIIDNDGTDAVNGTFSGLPERAMVTSGPFSLRISYMGGDGNDVVLSALAGTDTALLQGSTTSKFGEAVTLTANVSSSSGTPAGSVTFTVDGAALATVPLQNGTATFTTSALEAGSRNLGASFLGTGIFGDSTAAPIAHTVERGATVSTVSSKKPASVYGETVELTAAVAAQAPAAGQPTGTVTFLVDGVAAGTATVSGGLATLLVSSIHAGSRSITADYSGDAHFDGSHAPAIPQTVTKAQAAVDARSRTPLLIGEIPQLTVLVNATASLSVVPTGSIAVSEGGVALVAPQTLDGGRVQLALPQLAPGAHTLLVQYSGDGDVNAASNAITVSVVLPAVAVHAAHAQEGNSGTRTIAVPVTLSVAVSVPVRVAFATVPGSATAGADYQAVSGVIEFAPGETTRTIEVTVIGDQLAEADESFSVVLSDPSNATIETASSLVVIENDDALPSRRRSVGH